MKQVFFQVETSSKWLWVRLPVALPGIVLFILGISMYFISLQQPVWLENNIGPGLMAQWLSKVVAVIGIVWSITCVFRVYRPNSAGCSSKVAQQSWSGLFLLMSVLQFSVFFPILGLVLSSAIAAALASIGAGERHWFAILMTSLAMAIMTAGIGVTLLPPATQLWPFY